MTTVLDKPPPPSRRATTRSTTRARWTWAWVVFSSLAIAAYFTQQYARGSLDELADRHVGLAADYADYGLLIQLVFYVHVVSAGLALALGPWQFSARLRNRRPRLHRLNGKAYLVMVAVGSVSGLIMSFFNSLEFSGLFGFGALSVLWGWTGWRAYQAARSRDFRSHQAWAIRNFAITYAAVTLRLWFGLLILVQLPFAQGTDPARIIELAYAPVPYISWIPNLVVAEFLIRRRGLPALRLDSTGTGHAGKPAAGARSTP